MGENHMTGLGWEVIQEGRGRNGRGGLDMRGKVGKLFDNTPIKFNFLILVDGRCVSFLKSQCRQKPDWVPGGIMSIT